MYEPVEKVLAELGAVLQRPVSALAPPADGLVEVTRLVERNVTCKDTKKLISHPSDAISQPTNPDYLFPISKVLLKKFLKGASPDFDVNKKRLDRSLRTPEKYY